MKRHLFLYLFVFALLTIIYLFVDFRKKYESYYETVQNFENKLEKLDSINLALNDENFDLSYFKFDANEEAMYYFERQGYQVDELQAAIFDALYATNVYEGEDHPLIPYVSMTDRPILIDKARILNHRWIIANYTDGQHSGEIFLNYNVVTKDSINFKLTDYLMFPR
ncbi:MAG: hydrolase [Bacteroidota bacterium]